MKTCIAKSGAFFGAFFAALSLAAAERKISIDEYRDKMAGAWIGQTVGVTYGWPTEFKSKGKIIDWEKLPVWKPELINGGFTQDDLYVEMTFMKTLCDHGIDVSCRKAGIDFANSRYRLWCANNNARNNLRKGIAAPASSHPVNHKTTDDIDYQIEADFSGILSPGMPNRAVRFGEQFGRIMNYGDGLYGGQFIGAMYSEAFFEKDRVKTTEKALAHIPSRSKYAQMVRDMLSWYKEDPEDWRKAWEKAARKYGAEKSPMRGRVSFTAIDVKINGAMVLLGYLWGDGDVLKTAKISTAGGYDSDCNPSSAVGVLGTQIGWKGFDGIFTSKLDRKRKWEHTQYDFDTLIKVSEDLARKVVLAEGGRIVKENGTEYFVIPASKPAPSPFYDSKNPSPDGAGDRLTPEEMSLILYKPGIQGAKSVKKNL